MAWRIGEILIQKKLITWEQLQEALEEQERTKEFIGEILIRKKFISKLLLYASLAKQHHMRFVNLREIRINPKAIELIPRSIAQKYALFPVDVREGVLFIGIANPIKVWPEVELKQMAKVKEIQTVLCLPEEIDQMIKENY